MHWDHVTNVFRFKHPNVLFKLRYRQRLNSTILSMPRCNVSQNSLAHTSVNASWIKVAYSHMYLPIYIFLTYFNWFKIVESRIWQKFFRLCCPCFVVKLAFVSSPAILFFCLFIIDGFTLWILRQTQMSTIHDTVHSFFVNKGIGKTMTWL